MSDVQMGHPFNTANKKFFLSLLPLISLIKVLECGQGGRWGTIRSSYSHGSSQVPIGDLVWSEFSRLWLIIGVLPRNYKALHQGERIVEELIWDFKDMSWKLDIELVFLWITYFFCAPGKLLSHCLGFPTPENGVHAAIFCSLCVFL